MADAPFASPPAQLSAGHPVLGTDSMTHGSTLLTTGYNTPFDAFGARVHLVDEDELEEQVGYKDDVDDAVEHEEPVLHRRLPRARRVEEGDLVRSEQCRVPQSERGREVPEDHGPAHAPLARVDDVPRRAFDE